MNIKHTEKKNRSKCLPKKQNVFYSYYKIYRLAHLMIGHWPNQNSLFKSILHVWQLTVLLSFMKGQVIKFILWGNIHMLIKFEFYSIKICFV